MIYIVWGSTYLFIKMGVETMPPLYLVGGRFFLGGLGFLLFAFFTGALKSIPSRNEILSALFMGIFLCLLGNGCVSIGEKTVDSYLAALIVSSTPFVVAVFNWLFFREKLSLVRLLGMSCGIIGVAFILYNGNNLASSFTPGVIVVAVGLASWAFATSLGHRMKMHSNTLINSGMQMFFGGGIGLVVSLFIYPSVHSVIPAISVKSWIGLAYLTILGGMTFYCYAYLIKNEPSIRIVTYAIVNPPIAVVLGICLGRENPRPFLIPGLLLTLIGLTFILFGPKFIEDRKIFRKNK
jgi:drug/metabolite transporter (DMT)-like permease